MAYSLVNMTEQELHFWSNPVPVVAEILKSCNLKLNYFLPGAQPSKLLQPLNLKDIKRIRIQLKMGSHLKNVADQLHVSMFQTAHPGGLPRHAKM